MSHWCTHFHGSDKFKSFLERTLACQELPVLNLFLTGLSSCFTPINYSKPEVSKFMGIFCMISLLSCIQYSVLLAKGRSDKPWTGIGREIQSLSNVCQDPVQFLSMYKVCPYTVQQKDHVCQDTVQSTWFWTVIGQGNPGFVKTLSSVIFKANHKLPVGQSLDKLNMWTKCGY